MAQGDEPKKPARARASAKRGNGPDARPRASSANAGGTPSARPKARARHGESKAPGTRDSSPSIEPDAFPTTGELVEPATRVAPSPMNGEQLPLVMTSSVDEPTRDIPARFGGDDSEIEDAEIEPAAPRARDATPLAVEHASAIEVLFEESISAPPMDWTIPRAPAVPRLHVADAAGEDDYELDARAPFASSRGDASDFEQSGDAGEGDAPRHEADDDVEDELDEGAEAPQHDSDVQEILGRAPVRRAGLIRDSVVPPLAVPGGRGVYIPRASIAAPALDDETGSILITGICGRLGKLLVRELHRDMPVVGIDRRAFPEAPKDIVHHRFDLRRKKTRDVFRSGRVRAVVHLGVMHDPRSNHRVRHSWNVVAFQKLLEYMAQYRVRKLVVLSSANVYGPQPDNPQFLTEEAPLLGSQEFYAIRDLVELDMLAQGNFWKNPDVETVILRPCHILGEVRNAPSNYLRLENPVTILGFDPMVQVIHERDVVQAVRLALEPGVRGVFNLRGQGELPLSRILELAHRKPIAIAAPLARAAIQQLWRFRLGSFPAPEIDHIRYVCMVDDSRARQTLGYAPRYSLEDAIAAAINAA